MAQTHEGQRLRNVVGHDRLIDLSAVDAIRRALAAGRVRCRLGERLLPTSPSRRVGLERGRLVGHVHRGVADPHAYPMFPRAIKAVAFRE